MIEQKLNELGVIIAKEAVHHETELLHEYERLIGHTLPETYRCFLVKYKTSLGFENLIVYRPLENSPWDSNGVQELDELYGLTLGSNGGSGLSTLSKMFTRYQGRMPITTVPIAAAP